MNPAHKRRCEVAALLFLVITSPAIAGHPAELLPTVPGSANAVVVIDVESLLASKLAQRHGWSSKGSLEYAQRPVMVPTEATAVAIAASLDPGRELMRQWEVSIAEMETELSLEDIARREGGYIDKIGTSQVVWTPSDCYIVQLNPRRLAMVSPADRQAIGRWLEDRNRRDPRQVSSYLKNAASLVNDRTQVVMALDLANAVVPHRLDEAINNSPTLFKNPDKKDYYRELFLGLVGVTLKLSVNVGTEAELRIDFSRRPLADSLVKPLLLEILDRHDLHLSEVENWVVKSEGESLVIRGKLTTEGLRRVASLLELPTTKFSDLEGVKPAKPGSPDYAKRSQMYYRAVSSLIDDLNKTLKKNRDNHAVWMERYGEKVDKLPILNVDEELLDWGASVAETFRTMALAQRSAGIRQGVRKSSIYRNYGYSDEYGYYRYYHPQSQRTEIERQEAAQASKVRFESWKELEDSRAQIRRRMTKKYGIEF